MFKRLCIHNKLLIFFFFIIIIDLVVLYAVGVKTKNELVNLQRSYDQILETDSFFNNILTGDFQNSFLLSKGFPSFDQQNSSTFYVDTLSRYRNLMLTVFGFSLIAGIGVAVYFTRSVTHSALQLAETAGHISEEELKKKKLLPPCTKLHALSESLKKVQRELMEHEAEINLLDSVEITKNLAAGIAHEIKNPINTVGLTVDYLQSNLSPEDPEKRYEFYKLSDNMKNELKRINRIVEGFLRLTRPEVFTFDDKEDINSVIHETATLLEPEIVRQNVQIHLDLDSELPKIKIDKDKLRQVFSNLIINAIEAMPRGGDITIVSDWESEDRVQVSVSDNGIGIPEEEIKNVFSPYYTTKKQGFGLGLSLVYSIIHRHHGRINVDSEKGKGTEFIIQLLVDFEDE